MSELVVSSTSVSTSVFTLPLLSAAGVIMAAGRAVSRVMENLSRADQLISVNSLAQEFIATAKESRSRLLADIANHASAYNETPLPGELFFTDSHLHKDAADALARAQAIQKAISESPIISAVAKFVQREAIEKAAEHNLQAQAAFQIKAFDKAILEANHAEEVFASSAHEALVRLQLAQQQIVAQAVRTVLPQMGYQFEEAHEGQTTGFLAKLGENVLGIVVLEGGKILSDSAGFGGANCRHAQETFNQRLKEQGVEIHTKASFLHQRREGGPLLAPSKGARGLLEEAALLRVKGKKGNSREDERRRRTINWVWAQKNIILR
jgi:hypothetical protein